MATKYTCMDDYCSFTTTSESEAMRHVANNPTHKIARVSDQDNDEQPESEIIDIHRHEGE